MYLHLSAYQFVDTRRSDFWEMFVHHLATVGLILFSWMSWSVRGGFVLGGRGYVCVCGAGCGWGASFQLSRPAPQPPPSKPTPQTPTPKPTPHPSFWRIGTLVMLIHDPSDVFLETAKIFNYTSRARPWAQVRTLLVGRLLVGGDV